MFQIIKGELEIKKYHVEKTVLLSIYNTGRDVTILTTPDDWAAAVEAAEWARCPAQAQAQTPDVPSQEIFILPQRSFKTYELNWYQSSEQCYADEFARQMRKDFANIWNEGIHSHRGIARELNERCIGMRSGSDWDACSVKRVVKRLDRLYTDWTNEDE